MLQLALGTASLDKNLDTIINVINYAIDCGVRVIDTAECYNTEEFIGSVLKNNNPNMFIIGKVHPNNQNNIFESCENSLRKLKIDKFNLYLLHFDREDVTYSKVRDDFESLKNRGLIDAYGIGSIDINKLILINSSLNSNFSANQIWYNPVARNAENGAIELHNKHNISDFYF
jgi:diketogulonate reductase-like aldo/keto reductase